MLGYKFLRKEGDKLVSPVFLKKKRTYSPKDWMQVNDFLTFFKNKEDAQKFRKKLLKLLEGKYTFYEVEVPEEELVSKDKVAISGELFEGTMLTRKMMLKKKLEEFSIKVTKAFDISNITTK